MTLDEQGSTLPADLGRLIDQIYPGIDAHQVEELGDVFRIHAYAAVGHLHANASRPIRAVNEVRTARNVQAHLVLAERVVGPWRNHPRQRVATFLVLLAHGCGRIPVGALFLGHDARNAERRVPVHLRRADRVGTHDARLAGFGRRVIVEPVLRQVHDDGVARRVRKHKTRRDQDLGALARQPGIHSGIRSQYLLVAHAVAATDVEHRVLVPRNGRRDEADDVVAVRGKHVLGPACVNPGTGGDRSQHEQCGAPSLPYPPRLARHARIVAIAASGGIAQALTGSRFGQ